ncbi:hypothetical protein DFH09DRAFT_1093996 [Mycena vulgaris]|nr:hypothetical protein DFH09DRAFT_1093996 [Mycena vulgaris]
MVELNKPALSELTEPNHLEPALEPLWHRVVWQKESSGIAAVGCLCVIVLTSVAPVRRWCYSGFLVVHFLAFPAFFITLCYHTIYATPWIFPPIAFYAADVLLRVVRWRVVVARVEGRAGGLSLIHVPEAAGGWRAGQHVQVRALLGARAWEAHPLSVCCAAPGVSCLRGPDNEPLGLLLAARACGDWSRALHTWAIAPADDWYDDDTYPTEKAVVADATDSKRADGPGDAAHAINEQDRERGVPAQAQKQLALPGREAHLILDGPYGGPTLYAGDYARVLLFAGGSGATFTLGVLDELVGRATLPLGAGGEEVRTTRVVWCWRHQLVRALPAADRHARRLARLAHQAFYTHLRDVSLHLVAVPAIPGCVVTEARPHVDVMLAGLLGGGAVDEEDDEDGGKRKSEASSASASVEGLPAKVAPVVATDKGDWLGEDAHGGGVAVVAAGPGGLIHEAGNAVARANLGARGRRGGVLCRDVYCLGLARGGGGGWTIIHAQGYGDDEDVETGPAALRKIAARLRDPANGKQMVNKQFTRLYYLALCEGPHTEFLRVPGHLGGSYISFGTPVAGYAPNIVISHHSRFRSLLNPKP